MGYALTTTVPAPVRGDAAGDPVPPSPTRDSAS